MPTGGMLASAAMQQAPNLLQTGLGIYQAIRGGRQRKRALEQLEKNPYQVPASARRAVEIQGRLAQGTQLPGQDIIEERMASGTANALAHRITSYNVCYTKLLRYFHLSTS